MYIPAMSRWRTGGRLRLLASLILAQGLAGAGASAGGPIARIAGSSLSPLSSPMTIGVQAPPCFQPQYIRLVNLITGQPFQFSEGLACLPSGDQLSQPTIYWGDGSSSQATVTQAASPEAGESVIGQHTYSQPGEFQIAVHVTDDATGETLLRGWHTAVDVAHAPVVTPAVPATAPGSRAPAEAPAPPSGAATPISLRGASFRVREDRRRRGTVAVLFTNVSARGLRAKIHWGDGSVSRGALRGSPPELRVVGGHRWRRSGGYVVAVSVINSRGQVVATATGHARVR